MKSFFLSITIFSFLILGITANCLYVSDFSERLTYYSQSFPEDHLPTDRMLIDELTEFWQKNEFLLMLTNDHTRIHEVYHHIQSLDAAIIAGNFTLYTESRLAISEAAKDFKEFDTFSLIGVL